jgi:thiol-disulfide isomerase/thioredoxin
MKFLVYTGFLLTFFTCLGQRQNHFKQTGVDTVPNTKVVVHFKNQKDINDAFHTKFQQYQDLALEDYPILTPSNVALTVDGLTRTYSFHLVGPSMYNIGFHEFYVMGGDSIDMTYEMLGEDKNRVPLERITLNTPNSFVYLRNGRTTFSSIPYEVALYKMKDSKDVSKYFRLKHIDSLSTQYTNKIFSDNPDFKKTAERRDFVKQVMLQGNLNDLVTAFTDRISYFNIKDQEKGTEKLLQIYQAYSNLITYKKYPFYVTCKKLYTLVFEPNWRSKAFKFDKINIDLKYYDTLTRQYLLLLSIKNNLPEIRNDQENLKRINDAITNSKLCGYLEKYYSLGITDPDYLTNELRNVPVYDAALKETPFGKIFINTTQPFLYFDFCGSWCVPCLNEMEEYTQSERKYDHSDMVRPIYLFFENNQKEWLKVVEKYHLAKENCFVVIDKKLQTLMSRQFGWMGEFPHHFLFSKEGKIINSKADPLINLKEADMILGGNLPTSRQAAPPIK